MENVKELDAGRARLYMRYDKVFPSAQGMAVWEDLAFILYHGGNCAVYDLAARESRPLAVFPLGSANGGTPSAAYANHANQCMFSTLRMPGNPVPLLYVTTGNAGGADEDGFYYRCAVEELRLRSDGAGRCAGAESRLIQTISYAGEPGSGPWIQPCWGCPAWMADSENGWLYMFSAKYRTTRQFLPFREQNRYIITKFRLPDPAGPSFVKLGYGDIADQFTAPFDILFTQGGMVAGNKLYHTFGMGDADYPVGLRVYSLSEKRLYARMDLSASALGGEEIESCAFYRGQLLCNTNSAAPGIFSLGIFEGDM